MSFKNLNIKTEYRSLSDNMVDDFYIPLLNESISYKRAVGFFSSSALIEISRGISGLIKNGGKIQLVASPRLSEEDIQAIEKGFELRQEIIEKCIERSIEEPKNIYEERRLNLLANLVADGKLDIKIAFLEEKNNIGMFHEKMGLMIDSDNNVIAFTGSMNESKNAFSHNYESIDVFCSWTHDIDRVIAKENAFNAIWNDYEKNIKIIDFPNIAKEMLNKYKTNNTIDYDLDNKEFPIFIKENNRATGARVPNNLGLHDYQKEAIENWEKNGYIGIFDMATGTGKTYTGLGAISNLSIAKEDKLAVIIVAPFQHLVEQWVNDIIKFNMDPIIGYSASSQKNWKKLLEDAVLDFNLKIINRNFFCFICTNATFASNFVQSQLNKIRGNILLLVDEAHNFGSESLRNLLTDKYDYRIALSATLDRHNDIEGTKVLKNYFGEKCIEYSLERAITEDKLTPYKYYPIIVTLNNYELERYSYLSNEIGKCIMKGKNGKIKLTKKGEKLALERSRVIAGAKNKIHKLEELITKYIDDKHILVYCGAAKLLDDNFDYISVDEEDIRQIDAVTDLLGNKLNMRVSQFTSKENIKERELLKVEFSKGDNLQVLIAIKCLDEGVDIPNIKIAFILASTTNPKEYIQRRGRVLRKAEGKEYSIIYDFITLPRSLDEVSSLTIEQLKKELTLVKNELARADEFSRIALNKFEAITIIDEIKETYNLNLNDQVIYEEEF